jgi:hypothetical protein
VVPAGGGGGGGSSGNYVGVSGKWAHCFTLTLYRQNSTLSTLTKPRFLKISAVWSQPVSGHHPGGEHHPKGHGGPLRQQASSVGRGQGLHPEVPGLPEGRQDGRPHDGQGSLPLPATD